MEYIDITDCLELNDYYRTDPHWRQERITDVAEHLAESMDNPIAAQYEIAQLKRLFYGVYCGQSALSLPPEKMYYLTNDTLNDCEVFDYETNQILSFYDMQKAEGNRDSFGSSLAPLLVKGYDEIVLIDIRYISSKRLGTMVDFQDSDVLFLYSSLILNNRKHALRTFYCHEQQRHPEIGFFT